MSWIEIVVLIGAVALVAFTVIFNIVRKKKGKSSCGCGCPSKSCGDCCGCPKNPADCQNRREE